MSYTIIFIGICLYLTYRTLKFWIFDPWLFHQHLSSQGVPGRFIPIVGELLSIRRGILSGNPLLFNYEMREKYGDYYRLSLGPIAGFNISEPSLIDGVLKTNARYYRKSIFMQLIIGNLIGNDNLLTGEHEMHARHRRLISPLFQQQNINSMIPMMIEITSNLLDKWTQRLSQTNNQQATIDIREEMARLTLNIIAGCVFGKQISNSEHIHDTMYRSVTVILNELEQRLFNLLAIIPLIHRLPLPSKLKIDRSMRDLRKVVERIIHERKQGLTTSNAKGPDLLDLLLTVNIDHSSRSITDDEIYGEALTFILAGHETTSNLMVWALYNLSCHSDVYHCCQHEIDTVLSNTDSIDPSTLSLLNYTEAVLKETLRLYPSIPVVYRTATDDHTLETSSGRQIRIRKGTEIIINLYMLHHSEKFWSNPEKFDPCRFLHNQSDNYLPFSIGMRSCIGKNFAMLEAKIMLAMILRRFHIELQSGQDPIPDIAITLRPKHAMWIHISPRD